MTEQQRAALEDLSRRYRVEFDESNFHPQFDLPAGWVAGWVSSIYVGVSPEGDVNS